MFFPLWCGYEKCKFVNIRIKEKCSLNNYYFFNIKYDILINVTYMLQGCKHCVVVLVALEKYNL